MAMVKVISTEYFRHIFCIISMSVNVTSMSWAPNVVKMQAEETCVVLWNIEYRVTP
jgi:hypothetical protein